MRKPTLIITSGKRHNSMHSHQPMVCSNIECGNRFIFPIYADVPVKDMAIILSKVICPKCKSKAKFLIYDIDGSMTEPK